MAPQQRVERIFEEKGEPRSLAAQPMERDKELAPKQVRQATRPSPRHESPGDPVRVGVTTTTGRVSGTGQAALELHHMGGKSATHGRQEGPHQVRRRHARGRHLHVQEAGQVHRRQRHIGESDRPRVDVNSKNHGAGGLPKAVARIRQVLRPTAVGDEDDRCAIRPHIRRGRGNELRRPDARAAAGGHRTHVRARGTLPTESRTRHGIAGAGHGKWRTRTRAQRGGRAGSTARAGTAAPAMPTARVRAEERQHRRRDGRRRDGNEVAAGALPHERREGGGRRRERRRGRRGLRRRRGRRRRRRQRRQPLRTLNIVQFTRPKRLRPRL